MDLWILNNNLEQVGVIDDYKSLIWSKRYNLLGDCEVYIEASKKNVQLLDRGNYILRNDDDMICRIETIELDTSTEEGDYLIVTGADCRKILNQRIIWTQTNFNGTSEDFIRKIINDNIINPSNQKRKISNFKLTQRKGFTETIEIQSTYDNLFDKIQSISELNGYGSKVTFDGSDFYFDLYKGTDRSTEQDVNDVVIFSPDFENLISSKYRSDFSEVKTAALIAGDGEGTERITTIVDNEEGLDRYELYVDGNDVSSEISYNDLITKYPNGTIVVRNDIVYYVLHNVDIAILNHVDNPTSGTLLGDAYNVLLKQKGLEELAKAKTQIEFDGEVEPNYSYKFNQDYFLGDIVTVKNEYGVEANARVTEVIETDDDNGYSLIPTFEYLYAYENNQKTLLTENEKALLTESHESIYYI